MSRNAIYVSFNTENTLVDVFNHYKCNHTINIENSKLKDIIGKTKITVNSYHHKQVLKSKEFRVVARSYDGVIEAVETDDSIFQIGVEWHPERKNDENSKNLFQEFIRQIGHTIININFIL